VLEAVTPVALTVIDLELRLALARVTVIVELHPLGACQVGVQLTLVNTSQLFHQLGNQLKKYSTQFLMTLSIMFFVVIIFRFI
jgi:hypothetical protein